MLWRYLYHFGYLPLDRLARRLVNTVTGLLLSCLTKIVITYFAQINEPYIFGVSLKRYYQFIYICHVKIVSLLILLSSGIWEYP